MICDCKVIVDEYNHLNKVLSVITPGDNGTTIFYSYDYIGKAYHVLSSYTNDISTEDKDAVYTYNAADQVSSLKYPFMSSDSLIYAYNNRGWLSNISYPAFSENLKYEKNGNVSFQKVNTVWPDTSVCPLLQSNEIIKSRNGMIKVEVTIIKDGKIVQTVTTSGVTE